MPLRWRGGPESSPSTVAATMSHTVPLVVAVIPARGGSRRLPRKNLVPLGGRPLITWSILAGLAASCVDRVVVSTEDEEIAEVAEAAGADVPFRRPVELAGDHTPDLPVFQHALRWLASHEGYRPDVVVHLRPTSPARRPGLIDDGVARLLDSPGASSLRSVSPTPETPHKMWWVGDDGLLSPVCGTLEEELFNQPRQVLSDAWVHDGVLDVIRTEVISSGSMSGPRILAFTLGPDEGVDIDRPEDLSDAAAALARLGQGTEPPTGVRATRSL